MADFKYKEERFADIQMLRYRLDGFDKLTLRVKNDGCFLSKMDRGWFDSSTPWHLSVENPIDPSLDVGKASYHIKVGLNGAIQRSNSARSARTDSSL